VARHDVSCAQGTTDSEYSFMLFLQILFFGGKYRGDEAAKDKVDLAQMLKAADDTSSSSLPPTADEADATQRFTADKMRLAMTETVRLIAKWTSKTCTPAERERSGYSLLNYAVSDGVSAVVTRYHHAPPLIRTRTRTVLHVARDRTLRAVATLMTR
jgi:hypothetical protein